MHAAKAIALLDAHPLPFTVERYDLLDDGALRITPRETAQYPQRDMLMLVAALFLLLTWAILSLIYYSIRDRR